MWRRPACARLFAVLFLLLALIYIIVGCVYFAEYFPFYANSVFDETFFYTDIECWVGPDYLMTFWHVITFLLLLAIFFWFFYACMLCRLAHCACFIPCPPVTCSKVCEPPPPHPCCKVRWYQKVFKRGKCCPPPPCDPFPACPPTCPPVSLPPCPPRPTCPEQSCKVFSQCPQQSCQILPQDLQTYQTPATVAMQNPLPPPTQVSASAEPPPPPSPLCQPLVTKKCPKFVLTLKPGRLCK